MAKELEKTYNPSDIEQRTYEKWLDKKYFHAKINKDKKPFTIVMPPPILRGSFIWDMHLIIHSRIYL